MSSKAWCRIAAIAIATFGLASTTNSIASAQSLSRDNSSSVAAQIFKTITLRERAILLHAPVTFQEYSETVRDTVACLRSHGFSVSTPIRQLSGLINYQTSYSWGHASQLNYQPPRHAQELVNREFQNCANLSAAVGAAFVFDNFKKSHTPAWGFRKMTSCLMEWGVQVQGTDSPSNVRKILREVLKAVKAGSLSQPHADTCVAKFEVTTVTPLPGVGQQLRRLRNEAR